MFMVLMPPESFKVLRSQEEERQAAASHADQLREAVIDAAEAKGRENAQAAALAKQAAAPKATWPTS